MALELITGCMFSGKTGELLDRLDRLDITKKRILLFKPTLDNRSELDEKYSAIDVSSHNAHKRPAIVVPSTDELYKIVGEQKPDIIGIDEIQFFDEKIVDFCYEFRRDKLIIVAGLNMSFRGEPFPFRDSKHLGEEPIVFSDKHMGDLMVIGFNISRRALCMYEFKNGSICGHDGVPTAIYTQKLIDGNPAPYNSPLVSVGADIKNNENVSYQGRCEKHYRINGH
ncbi:hypothetical protein J4468_00760 [Candidatus Woesearchaeota archaeon]|nr:hypothetical protein [Candidatus Woesearchaeota archaeon]